MLALCREWGFSISFPREAATLDREAPLKVHSLGRTDAHTACVRERVFVRNCECVCVFVCEKGEREREREREREKERESVCVRKCVCLCVREG